MSGRLRLLNEVFGQVLPADLLQVPVAQAELPAHVHRVGQRFPVPFAFVLDVLGHVLFQLVVDQRLDGPRGFFLGQPLGGVEVHIAIIARLERIGQRQLRSRPLAKGSRTVVGGQDFVEVLVELLLDHVQDQLLAVGPFENSLPVAVDSFALFVHHLVIFEQALAGFKVVFLAFFLSAFDPAADHPAFDRFAFLHAKPGENVLHPFAGEDPHQVVFE